MRKEFEANKGRDLTFEALEKRMKYEERYKSVLGSGKAGLTFADIPWPSKQGEAMDISVLFDKMETGGDEYKKYLRDQQIRWHPDKFMQRFGARVDISDKDKILARVTVLSQKLNQLKS